MAEPIAFDTHRFVKRLTECGFTERQAETLAEEHVALLNSNLAAKTDIAKVEAALKTDIAKVQAEVARVEGALKTDIAKVEAALKTDLAKVQAEVARVEGALTTDIAAVKADLLKWMFGALIVQGALIVSLVKLL